MNRKGSKKKGVRRVSSDDNSINNSSAVKNFKIGRYLVALIFIYALYLNLWPKIKELGLVDKINPVIEIKGLTVSGFGNVDSALIVDAAGIDSGTTILTAGVDEIRNRVCELGAIADAKVKIKFNRTISISVVEREPIAFVLLDKDLFFVDKTGSVWRFVSGKYWEIPVVVGVVDSVNDDGKRVIDNRSFRALTSLSVLFKEAAKTGNRVTMYDFRDRDMVSLQLNGLEPMVRVGTDVKSYTIDNIKSIIELLKKSDIKAKDYIDMSYSNVAFIH